MNILILGGGSCQLNAILKAKEKGVSVIVSDYYEKPLAKEFIDFHRRVSTFDIAGNIEVAKEFNIDGVLTVGTDQPVYTAAKVSEKLNLKSFIDSKLAKRVTNKLEMKKIFHNHNIPMVNYAYIYKDFSDEDLKDLKFPVVVKPVDSQGQRGVFKLNSLQEVRDVFKDVLSFSRDTGILVEEYYANDEITVSGWVKDDDVHILTITDRISNSEAPYIGVCTAHNYPSAYAESKYEEISSVTKSIVQTFEIHNGPIYFQMFVGKDGIKANEIACRIGGAYEDILIPLTTGVDILEMQLDGVLRKQIDYEKLNNVSTYDGEKYIQILLFFLRPGKVISAQDTNKVKNNPNVINVGYNFKIGDSIEKMVNASQRAGYLIVKGNTKEDLEKNMAQTIDSMKILDDQKNDMVIRFDNTSGRFI